MDGYRAQELQGLQNNIIYILLQARNTVMVAPRENIVIVTTASANTDLECLARVAARDTSGRHSGDTDADIFKERTKDTDIH